ncbi:hypothetical protein M5K25_010218 [Dendrobium thyrsiflorum]|uniref:LOB domain-containing protein n=1 Tax=Dendrobium thyrsiflorum TaxID=117978 RepID=A0ABD0V656_DENTH
MSGGSFSSTNTYFESSISINGGRRCAACKFLRRRCSEDCILAPFFHHSQPDRFAFVHKIFGASNVARMLQQLPAHERAQAADAIAMEAHWRVQNPIYGCTEIIARLQNQITTAQNELAVIKAHLTIQKAHLQPRDQAQGNNHVVAKGERAHSYLKDNYLLLPELSNLPLDFC